jgi:methylated-DNA-protein-cysteine methyltransferase related protein
VKSTPSEVYRRIWAVASKIPRGQVATYGQIANLAGVPGQPRLVGYAMRHNPHGNDIPWHRVVNARGEISERASGEIERSLQRALLEEEGVRFDGSDRIPLETYRWRPRSRPSQA